MALFIPDAAQILILEYILNQNCRLKLFANNHTPAVGDTLASLTEVTGGGYAEIVLPFADWAITAGPPAVALFDALQDFNFTGATGGTGNVYGYYITNAAEDELIWEQRFATTPFTPQNGALIRIRPRITCGNAA